jgi:hypothetical protein
MKGSAMMVQRYLFALVLGVVFGQFSFVAAAENDEDTVGPLDITPQPVATDGSVRYDYDIVYVRARRAGDKVHKQFCTDIAAPVTLEPGANLMLLRPDASEESLVAGGDEGSVTDPYVYWRRASRGSSIESPRLR